MPVDDYEELLEDIHDLTVIAEWKDEPTISLEELKQEHNRFRFWGLINDLEGRVLRVITLEDKRTIHNAFPDRRFKP